MSRVRELEAERQAAHERDDAAPRAGIVRELRDWSARRVSARLVEPTAADRVRFGMRVGEDEADATHGLISRTAPLAQALLGRAAGDGVSFQGGEAEIVSIEP
jgi:transcription elongation GreA/GreB family factor